MATQLPRLNVTVTPSQHRLLAELGKLQGRSSASFLKELLDAATPLLEASLPIWQQVADEAAAQPERLRAMVQQALLDVKGSVAQLDMMDLIVRASDASNDAAEAQGEPSVARTSSASAASSKRSRGR